MRRRLYEGDELYDRKTDPRETTNLSGDPAHEGVERELRDALLDWLLATSDVIPWDADPRFTTHRREAASQLPRDS